MTLAEAGILQICVTEGEEKVLVNLVVGEVTFGEVMFLASGVPDRVPVGLDTAARRGLSLYRDEMQRRP